jgi:hypothetical protein
MVAADGAAADVAGADCADDPGVVLSGDEHATVSPRAAVAVAHVHSFLIMKT